MLGMPVRREFLQLSFSLFLLLGLFLTFRGYRSREGDQAYRLPILIHHLDSTILAGDPFVGYFDAFNPHRGSLALLDLARRPLGLSVGILALFLATFLLTGFGITFMTRTSWPDAPPILGIVAAALVYFAQAGNIGTNHLFEPILLDRMIAHGLGWVAIAMALRDPDRGVLLSAWLIGLIAFIHPSIGLQLALLIACSKLAWFFLGADSGGSWQGVARNAIVLGLAVIPGYLLNVGDTATLFGGLSSQEFHLFCAELQSPQHMLPHLWRLPQWLSWGCYPLLAWIAIRSSPSEPSHLPLSEARNRLMIVLGCTLVGLAIAWVGVEVVGNLKLTIFQPFRLATVARGLSLVFVAGHIMRLWNRGDAQGRTRAALIGTGLTGDWSLVVVTLFECIMWFIDRHAARFPSWRKVGGWCGAGFLACGLWFLAKHDTESGHIPLLAVSFISIAFGGWFAGRLRLHGTRQLALRTILCWIVPAASCAANLIPEGTLHGRASRSLRLALVKHCRFAEIPVDDVERLALWCRENTPKSARFIGPPGQKNFRLWSHRGLAFNRAGSPYHAAGLSDWAARFRDHVAFEGSNAELVQAYLSDRHGLESRYDLATAGELTALAIRQEADHVLARSGLDEDSGACLLAIRVEGPYAIYRVQPVASRAGPTSKSDGDLQRVSSAPRWTNPVPLPR